MRVRVLPGMLMLESEKYDIACTWGDGPDVLLTIEILVGTEKGKKEFHDLTAEQARRLAQDLIIAAEHVDELNRLAEQYKDCPVGETDIT